MSFPGIALPRLASRTVLGRLLGAPGSCHSSPSHTAVRGLATVDDQRSRSKHFGAVVIGAGPGGLTCASSLLDQGIERICMVDPSFTAGRIDARYREVPSNTKAGLFAQWAEGTEAFRRALARTPRRDALVKLHSLDPDRTCRLSDAIDVAQLVSRGLRQDSRVQSITGKVDMLAKHDSLWTLPSFGITADRVVLAPGAHPESSARFASHWSHVIPLELDTVLKPSLLPHVLPPGSKVAVVGASHSAILALMNLHEYAEKSGSGITIKNFYRSPLRYAIYKDGWILYDNTGLKGTAATWAKEVLDSGSLPSNIQRICLRDSRSPESSSPEDTQRIEQQIYNTELKDCTHLVSAIGFESNKLPGISIDQHITKPEFDPLSGRFHVKNDQSRTIVGLYGAGIAFPERVTDREGNVERAVGWFKFLKFLRRVAPEWVERVA